MMKRAKGRRGSPKNDNLGGLSPFPESLYWTTKQLLAANVFTATLLRVFKPVQENRFSSPGERKCVSKREAALIKSTSESGDNRDTRFGESLETVRRWSWNGGGRYQNSGFPR